MTSQSVAEHGGSSAYQALESRFRRLGALREAAGMLHWDMSTMMPAGGAEARTEQLAALDVTCHELLADRRMGDLLSAADEESHGLDPWRRANLREMRRAWLHATALEADLVEALSRAEKRCEMIWREARPANDFKAVLPALETQVGLIRQGAAAKAEALGLSPYDALLDRFEPGGRAERIDAVFDPLAEFLPDFLGAVLERQASAPAPYRNSSTRRRSKWKKSSTARRQLRCASWNPALSA